MIQTFLPVGTPLEVEKTENPTEDQINTIHERFITSLKDLFDVEKGKYLEDPTTELIIT